MSASDSAKSRMERILRLHEQIDALKLDIRQVYAEEKADGGDKTAMGAAVSYIRKRDKEGSDLADREAMADVYVAAYDAPRTHTHAREASYSEAKGRGRPVDLQDEAGELTDNQESGQPVEVRTEGVAIPPVVGTSDAFPSAVSPAPDESETDDVGATASSTNSPEGARRRLDDLGSVQDGLKMSSDGQPAGGLGNSDSQTLGEEKACVTAGETAPHFHSQATPLKPAMKTGEAPSSQASPATVSDLPISTTPSFSGRVTGEMPDIPESLRRTEGGYLKHDVVEA